MKALIANDAVLQLFHGLSGTAEVRDAAGNLVGYVASAEDPLRKAYLEARQHFDPEELKRRKGSTAPYLTLAEVFQRLESLENK